MKKYRKAAFAILVFTLFVTNSFSFIQPHAVNQKALLLDYEWFRDPDFMDATGSVATAADELMRLNNIHTGYTFSLEGSPGYSPFEYGYYPSQPVKIIYSNIFNGSPR